MSSFSSLGGFSPDQVLPVSSAASVCLCIHGLELFPGSVSRSFHTRPRQKMLVASAKAGLVSDGEACVCLVSKT